MTKLIFTTSMEGSFGNAELQEDKSLMLENLKLALTSWGIKLRGFSAQKL